MHGAEQDRQLSITLLQERASGTFARVYLAEASSEGDISRIVAVKVLKEQWGASEDLLARTRDEARLLARLHHKNILRVEGLAQIEGQQAIVMEFVDGVDLKQLIEELASRGGRIPPRPAYSVALGAASALQAAHTKVPYGRSEPLAVVHRDLKPSNVMVSREGEVKVLDFGTARFTHEARAAKTGVMRFGSMKYMSPERRLGDRGEHASDVYSLGLLLIEMLRGELLPLLPIERTDHDATIAELIAGLEGLGLPNAEWRSSLEQMLHRMCHHEPSARLDAGQVVALLRAFADQAEGPGLETWASTDVSRIATAVYGDDIEGALSGSQVFMRMSAGGAGVGPASRQASGAAQGASTGPSGAITRNGPGRLRTAAPPGGSLAGGAPLQQPAPLDDEPTMVQGFAPAEGRAPGGYEHTEPEVEPLEPPWAPAPEAADARFAVGPAPASTGAFSDDGGWSSTPESESTPPPEPAQPSSPGPIRGGRAQDRPPGLQAVPPPPERASSHAPGAAPQRSRTMLLGLAGLAFSLVLFGGGGLAAAFWWMTQTPESSTGGEPAASASAPIEAAPTAGAKLRLSANDATLQWLKLTDAAGDRVLKASPDGDAVLAPGTYTLAAKVVGRGAVSAELDVQADSDWTCTVAEAGAVECTSETGSTLRLEP